MSNCTGWPNGKKLACTCIQIWAQPKSTKVDVSGWPNDMQVQNLRQLASPFGQGFRFRVRFRLSVYSAGQKYCWLIFLVDAPIQSEAIIEVSESDFHSETSQTASDWISASSPHARSKDLTCGPRGSRAFRLTLVRDWENLWVPGYPWQQLLL